MAEEDLEDIYITFRKTKDSRGITLEEFENYLTSRQIILTGANIKRITEIK